MRLSGVFTAVLALGSAAALAVWLSMANWHTLVGDDSVSVVIRNIGLLAAAGTGLLVGAWRTMATHKQADAALAQAKSAQIQADASFKQATVMLQKHEQERRNALDVRFRSGSEILGAQSAHVRLGGMRALYNLAIENDDLYGKQVRGLLEDFIYIRKQESLGNSPESPTFHDESYGEFNGPPDAYRAWLLLKKLNENGSV